MIGFDPKTRALWPCGGRHCPARRQAQPCVFAEHVAPFGEAARDDQYLNPLVIGDVDIGGCVPKLDPDTFAGILEQRNFRYARPDC